MTCTLDTAARLSELEPKADLLFIYLVVYLLFLLEKKLPFRVPFTVKNNTLKDIVQIIFGLGIGLSPALQRGKPAVLQFL